MEMAIVILIVALVVLDVLAMRFGADSRDLEKDTRDRLETTYAQI